MPKISPQKAAGKLHSNMPNAVVRKVTSAASRSLGTAIAPASAAISSLGSAENSETRVAPKIPSSR